MLELVASANQTAPSGATASRPRRTIGVSIGVLEISPSGVIRETALAAMSVYQTLPSGAAARPSGSMLLPGFGSHSSWPSRTRPSAAAPSIVNQTEPSPAGGDRDRHALPLRHRILDEAGARPAAPQPPGGGAGQRQDDRARRQREPQARSVASS